MIACAFCFTAYSTSSPSKRVGLDIWQMSNRLLHQRQSLMRS